MDEHSTVFHLFNLGNKCFRIQRTTQNECHHSWNEHGPWESVYSPTECMYHPNFNMVSSVPTNSNYLYNWSEVHVIKLYHFILYYRTTNHFWPSGKTRTQRAWSSFTTRLLCGTMTHNPTCSTSTDESLRPPSRISKSFTTTTVSWLILTYLDRVHLVWWCFYDLETHSLYTI